MEESFLPSDLRYSESRDGEGRERESRESEKKIIYPQLTNPSPIFKPTNSTISTNSFSKPNQEFNNEKIETKKKVNFFVKMSNFVSRRSKLSLIFILCLILCILILIIYYRGILFLGPYCPNNIKSKKYKEFNDMGNKSPPDGKLLVDNNKILKSLR
jgi:hypothetical protein